MFEAAVVIVSILAGGVASVTGFGIGSLLTPLLALQLDPRVAVAAISIPHLIGTGLRLSMLRGHVDRRVLWTFGLTSAAGGLAGALLHNWASSPWLTTLFGALLVFVAVSEMIGLSQRMRFNGLVAWIAGALSGLLGGLVGNQGGIRSAALLGFDLRKETMVATATAIGLMVDAARMPVYFYHYHDEMAAVTMWIALATVGVVAGTVIGKRLLTRIPEVWFRRVLAVILAVLGITMLARGFG
ncbi:MAG TPA: sulfite exporter TauE/SafE family protein [Vicinamibacterales bacterium]|nr:sulfite exporter TauE/SafE family protein [Vicinamibacterales bacterium]